MEGDLLLKLKRELEIVNSSKKTIKAYMYYVEKFLLYSKGRELNEDLVKDFIQNEILIKDPSTVSSEISAIKYFFKKVLGNEININHPKRNKYIPEVLTVEEVKRLLEVTSNIKHRLIIKLLYGCGLRVSEIVSLKMEDINFDENLDKLQLMDSLPKNWGVVIK